MEQETEAVISNQVEIRPEDIQQETSIVEGSFELNALDQLNRSIPTTQFVVTGIETINASANTITVVVQDELNQALPIVTETDTTEGFYFQIFQTLLTTAFLRLLPRSSGLRCSLDQTICLYCFLSLIHTHSDIEDELAVIRSNYTLQRSLSMSSTGRSANSTHSEGSLDISDDDENYEQRENEILLDPDEVAAERSDDDFEDADDMDEDDEEENSGLSRSFYFHFSTYFLLSP